MIIRKMIYVHDHHVRGSWLCRWCARRVMITSGWPWCPGVPGVQGPWGSPGGSRVPRAPGGMPAPGYPRATPYPPGWPRTRAPRMACAPSTHWRLTGVPGRGVPRVWVRKDLGSDSRTARCRRWEVRAL